MTEAEALAKMKRLCRVLPNVFTDDELKGFLSDNLADAVYNVRASIYDALTSAATTEYNTIDRGNASETRTDFMRLRRQFSTAGTISAVRTVEELADDAFPE